MTHIITKTIKGDKFIYTFNGKVVRTSKRDYKYACVATYRAAKGANEKYEGLSDVISLGNNPTSTYNSYAKFYHHADLEVVEIQ